MLRQLHFTTLLFLLIACCKHNETFAVPEPLVNKQKILYAFEQADRFMNTDHYDSAQFWLNKIYLKISYQKPSLFSYFLSSRQAEIYYYNNLHQLGLQEALKADNIASILKDSVLIADASNFIGLFYMNNNKLKEAVNYFKKGLHYYILPTRKKQYLELSKPHHIYGNLAEVFDKMNIPDSAIFYSRQSLIKAKEIKSDRGMATACLNMGCAYLSRQLIDSAEKYFSLTKELSIASLDFDVELNSYSGLAIAATETGKREEAFKQLDIGFSLLKEYPQLNDFYTMMFLDVAIKIYKKYAAQILLNKTLELKSQIQTATYKRNNMQIESILSASLQNEKTIFNLELEEYQNKQSLANTRLYIILLLFLLLVAAFVAYRYYVLQRLKVAHFRNKLSRDLHDEVGATLSGIAMYSYITKEQIRNNESEQVNNSLDVIKDNASEMIAKLNDIVWAVNPIQDNLYQLLQRLKDFTLQLAVPKDIAINFIANEGLSMLKLPMEKRKNIYLICKEAVNNAVKYSECTSITIQVSVKEKYIYISIADNGKGFSTEMESRGNGLKNMLSRAEEIKAKLEINSRPDQGTFVIMNCKIT